MARRESRPIEFIFVYDILRFWSLVDRRDPQSCWNFTGSVHKYGYGRFYLFGYLERAHRVAYHIGCGELLPGCDVHHRCENKACCNPLHLEQLTKSEHAARHARIKARAA